MLCYFELSIVTHNLLMSFSLCNVFNLASFVRAGAKHDGACVSGGERLMGSDRRHRGAGDFGGALIGDFAVVSSQTARQTEQHTRCFFLLDPYCQFRICCARYPFYHKVHVVRNGLKIVEENNILFGYFL